MIKPGKLIIASCITIVLLWSLNACKRHLDKDGGYYDEKTQTYKYVKPKRRGFSGSTQQVYPPLPGKPQTISGTVARISDDAKSVWLLIEDRKPYMILASSLSGSSRDDKNKLIQLNLSYVSPGGSIRGSNQFRQKWKKYVIQILGSQLLNRKVLAELNYLERSRRFTGHLYQTVKTTNGTQTLDVNLWMIQQGLSFYFIDKGKSPRDKEYIQAQNSARKAKKGIWQY